MSAGRMREWKIITLAVAISISMWLVWSVVLSLNFLIVKVPEFLKDA
jgi:hypothetical protein